MAEININTRCKNCGECHGEHNALSDGYGKYNACPTTEIPKTWREDSTFEAIED